MVFSQNLLGQMLFHSAAAVTDDEDGDYNVAYP
jgi:hypothetical protein